MNIKKLSQTLLILLLTVSSATIFAANTDTSSNAAANSIYTEDKLNIMVAPGQPEFTIKLKSNPSTGYSWFLREYDNTLITPVKHAFQQPTKGLIGAPGYETWVFRVKQAAFIVPQQTTIRMIYARPWQGSDSSTQTVFRVTIQGK